MPLATLTRDITAPFDTDAPVEAPPTFALWGNSQSYMVWITRTSTTHGAEKVGTFQHVTPAASGDGWLMWDQDLGTHLRLHGAAVDPDPVNGRTYRLLGGNRYLLRYNDEDHRGDRHRRDNPWSIIGGEGTAAHMFPSDSPVNGYVEPRHYIEVADPGAASTDDRSSEAATDGPVFITNAADGPTKGLAVMDGEGRVALNPERTDGKTYLVWDTENTNHREVQVAVFYGPADPDVRAFGFTPQGAYYGGGETPADARFTSSARTLPDSRVIAWAELALVAPAALTDDQRAEASTKAVRFYSQAAALDRKYEEFNEALNDLAKEKAWCSEYEDIITPLGMTGRNTKYNVEVSVDVSFDVDSPSSGIDRAISSDIGWPVEASTLRVTTSMTVTVNDVECSGDPDNMSEYISTSDVEEAVDNMLSSVSNIEVDDWSVEDWSSSND